MAEKRKKPAPRPVKKVVKKIDQGIELTDNPRLAAFRVLKESLAGQTSEEALASHGLLLSPKDLGLTTALVYEVLRHRSRLDRLMKSRLSQGKASPDLVIILYLGLAQLLFFQRLGDHAVVSETVALAKTITPGRHGLVNAVLRGLLRDKDKGLPWPPMPAPSGDPASDLATTYSYPKWLVRKILARFSRQEGEALLAAGNQPTPPTLRVNPLKITREELGGQLPFETQATDMSPWGLRAEAFAGRPENWPGFAEGCFSLQDEASQLAALIAGNMPEGSKIFDACSGLGGKALALAITNPKAYIVAADKDAPKLSLLKREAERLGCENIECKVEDMLAPETHGETGQFDLVLVDAPCSGLGVIRRRPDLKWNKNEDDIPRLAELQLKLLSAGSKMVKPGGRLLYGVCSFSEEEGPEVAAKFLSARPEFSIASPSDWPENLKNHLSPESCLRLWPHLHNTDGFFWALFFRR